MSGFHSKTPTTSYSCRPKINYSRSWLRFTKYLQISKHFSDRHVMDKKVQQKRTRQRSYEAVAGNFEIFSKTCEDGFDANYVKA